MSNYLKASIFSYLFLNLSPNLFGQQPKVQQNLDSCKYWLQHFNKENTNPADMSFIFEKLNGCLEVFEKNEDWINVIKTANFIGPIYHYEFNNFSKFEKIMGQSNSVMIDKSISGKDCAETLHNLGFISFEKKRFDIAFEFYKKSIQIEELSNTPDLADTYNGIANVYKLKGDYENARLYLQKVIDLYRDTLHYNIPAYYLDLARTYKLQNKYEEAIAQYKKYYKISDAISQNFEHKKENKPKYFKQVDYMCHTLDALAEEGTCIQFCLAGTTTTTDATGNYLLPGGPYACDSYSAELTNGIPDCYLDTGGNAGPINFSVNGDGTPDGAIFVANPLVPALSQWGLICLSLLLMTFGALRLSQKIVLL